MKSRLSKHGFLVKHRVYTRVLGKGNLVGYSITDETTDRELDAAAISRIKAIPRLHSFEAYDGPEYCGPHIFSFDSTLAYCREWYWYIHYRQRPYAMKVGEGTVMILERGTGRVVYNGTDGME